MDKKHTRAGAADTCICVLLLLSMLPELKTEIAGFPLYSLALLMITSVWLVLKISSAGREGTPFLNVRYLTDTAAIAALLYALLAVVAELFGSMEEGGSDFSWNAEVISLALICLMLSSGVQFRMLYLDLLVYSGLLTAGCYILMNLEGGWNHDRLAAAFADSGPVSSCFLLISMISVYGYCTCRDRLRSVFYGLAAGVGFFALFLNQNAVSLWLMGIFFLAIPVVFRPAAILVKRAMQLFFVYLFMLSNMSLLTEYTEVIRAEVSYSLKQSVYLDLLLAAGGILFFHYWERIPEGTDLERLALRKMQKGYRFLLKAVLLIFVVIVLAGDGWTALPEGIAFDMVKGFAVPLAETAGREESGFFYCFRSTGVVAGIFVLLLVVLFLDRLWRNYEPDKPVTDILVLISVVFLGQLLFWNPGIHNIVGYFYLLMAASFYKEEREPAEYVGVNVDDL